MEFNKIYKPSKFDNFTIVPATIFRHKDISIGATGLYCWLFSHKSEQEITLEFICNHFKEGRDAISKRINELINNGYLIKEVIRDKGKFMGINYYLNESPQTEKPLTENPLPENQPQSNIIYNNIYIYKSNISGNILKSYKHFFQLFPSKYQPNTKTQLEKWVDVLDKIERIDKYDLKEVYLACKYFREHDFWSNNFFTILKLRNKDKNGIKFIHRFMDIYKSKKHDSN